VAANSTSGTPETPDASGDSRESADTAFLGRTAPPGETVPLGKDGDPDRPTGPAAEPAPGAPRHVSRFKAWRWRRPFWGGLLLTVAGALVLATMLQGSLQVVLQSGVRGVTGYILPGLMIICGVLLLFSPAQRVFYSIVGMLASLGSWATSNMGAFMVGTILGVVGSTLAFGWLPDQGPRRRLLRGRSHHGQSDDGGAATGPGTGQAGGQATGTGSATA
jgi:hypothetical protein